MNCQNVKTAEAICKSLFNTDSDSLRVNIFAEGSGAPRVSLQNPELLKKEGKIEYLSADFEVFRKVCNTTYLDKVSFDTSATEDGIGYLKKLS